MNYKTLHELRAAYQATFGCPPPPAASWSYMFNNLAYHAHCREHGGLPEQTVRELHRIAKASQTRPQAKPMLLAPGTRLVRMWQGVPHEVTVADGTFLYQDRAFRSLSAIARHITGSSWNGHAFFGLRKDTGHGA